MKLPKPSLQTNHWRWRETPSSPGILVGNKVRARRESRRIGRFKDRTLRHIDALCVSELCSGVSVSAAECRAMRATVTDRRYKERFMVRRHASGFTLIELVISAALMSMILFSAYLCLSSGVASQKLIESREEVLQSARVALTLISADLRSACALSQEFEFLGMHRMLGEVEADNLDFATHNYNPRHPLEADFCETSYFLEKNPKSGQFVLWRRRDPTPDPDPLSGGSREEIARGLRGLRFEYYDGFEWFDEWGDPEGRRKGQTPLLDPGNLTGLPEAVRITLWFDPNPYARPAMETSPEKDPGKANDSAEPPLAFQTVARLNLAAIAQRTSSGSSSGNSGGNASGQPAQAEPGGGPN
jgi:type II secretion system protein J